MYEKSKTCPSRAGKQRHGRRPHYYNRAPLDHDDKIHTGNTFEPLLSTNAYRINDQSSREAALYFLITFIYSSSSMSSEGPYGRHGFQSNPGGGGYGGGASYGGGAPAGGAYMAPSYGGGYGGGASYAAPSPQGYGGDYGGYSAQGSGDYMVGLAGGYFQVIVPWPMVDFVQVIARMGKTLGKFC